MFSECRSLTSLDLTNLNTSQVTSMTKMFLSCTSLISLDLSYFITSQVAYMYGMFECCSSLTSLDLSNFNTSKVREMSAMFYNCDNLEYINLKNFEETGLAPDDHLHTVSEMMYNVSSNAVICIDEIITKQIILSEIKKYCRIIDCTNDWKSKQKKLINNNNYQCFESCKNTAKNKYEYNGKCYENCTNGFLYDENKNQIDKCKCELEKCLLCPNVALKKELCTQCNANYYPKENDPSNLGEYINCYNNFQEGYYLDNNLYKKCYYTCKSCNISGDNTFHNCIECNDNFPLKILNEIYFNCYKNNSFNYYSDSKNIYYNTTDISSLNEYPEITEDIKEHIKNNINEIIDYPKINEIDIEAYANLIKIIEQIFTSENYDTSKLGSGQEENIDKGKINITLTTLENQRKYLNNKEFTIDLGDCEFLLKNYYNITDNKTLYMKIINIAQEGIKAKKVKYDIYCKLNGTNLIKLNLKACINRKILMLIPFEINKNIDEYNSSSGYYNDICYTTTSEDRTDIPLKDRQKRYIKGDKIVCQENCFFSKYDPKLLLANCSCYVKESSSSLTDITIDKAKLIEYFKYIKNFVNLSFLICYKKLFNKAGIINNIGAFLLAGITFLNIISIFIFFINQFSIIKKKIKDIIFGIKEYKIIESNKKRNNIVLKSGTKKHKNSNEKKVVVSKNMNKKVLGQKNNNKRNIKAIHINKDNKFIYNITNKEIKKNHNYFIKTNTINVKISKKKI